MVIVSGAPFSGKGQYVRAEIERREADGALGLLAIDYTAIFSAIVPGVQSSYRDDRIRATGAGRFVGTMYEAAVRVAAERELDGYTTTDSPRRAIALAERFGPGTRIIEVQATEEDLAERTLTHLRELARKVPRARAETRAEGSESATTKCTQAQIAHFRELDALAGKARGVKRVGKVAAKKWVSTGAVQAFDRSLWLSGLTPAGHRAVRALIAAGTAEPGPADVMTWLLVEDGRLRPIEDPRSTPSAADSSPGRHRTATLINYRERAHDRAERIRALARWSGLPRVSWSEAPA